MTVVNSLTATVSGAITDSTSAFLYVVERLQSKYITMSQLQDYGMGQIGAMQALPDSTNIGININSVAPVVYSLELYDFGGWIPASSLGIFQVPDDHWEYVKVGASTVYNNANFADFYIVKNTAHTWGLPWKRHENIGAGGGYVCVIESAPIQVVSGDTFGLRSKSILANTITAGTIMTSMFWIQPIKARFT